MSSTSPLLKQEYKFCTLQTALDDHVLIITINRPARLNALHPPAHAELEDIFDAFEADNNAWVAIITGSGSKAFCAGFDLRWLAENGGKLPKGNSFSPSKGFGGLTKRKSNIKPIIAAVNGLAYGGGFELALSCDIIIGHETAAKFCLPEPKRGLAAFAGGLTRLPRLLGYQRAMDVILRSRVISAAEAKSLGILTETVERQEDLLKKALEIAQTIIQSSPDSIQASKAVVQWSLEQNSVIDAIEGQYNLPAVQRLLKGSNMKEGSRAFVEKRAPRWKAPSKL